MILLRGHEPSTRGHLLALFGLGLIGRWILEPIASTGQFGLIELDFDWCNPSKRQGDVAAVSQHLAGLFSGEGRARRTDIIWAAGRGGFGASDNELKAEQGAFEDVLSLAVHSLENNRSGEHAFHLVSSAGGLFEGQRQVGQLSAVHPRRPYGDRKLDQEVLLQAAPEAMHKFIYRPSSVYGYSHRGTRRGLVSALIDDALRRRPSYIFGSSATVRDYVLAADVGKFVAARILGRGGGSETFLLASGKPTSTYEILQIVRHAIGRPLHLRFDPRPFNADDITFLPSALPNGWAATDVETGIRMTASKMRASFARAW